MNTREIRPLRQQRPGSAERRPNRSKPNYANLALVGAAILGPPAAVGAVMHITNESSPVEAFEAVVDDLRVIVGSDQCPAPPTRDVLANYTTELQHTQYDLNAATLAAKSRGLTFTDSSAILEQLQVNNDPFTATEAISDFTEDNYGFQLTLDVPADDFAAEGAVSHYLHDLEMFMRYTSHLPRELLFGIHIDKVRISHWQETHKNNGQFQLSMGYRQVDLDINAFNQSGLFIHEAIGHGVQFAVCPGGIEGDHGFSFINPEGFRYTGTDDAELWYPVTVSHHAANNVKEDYADTTRNLAVGVNSELRSWLDTPAFILDKTSVVMQRLDSIASGSADYLSEARLYFAEIDDEANAIPDFEY